MIETDVVVIGGGLAGLAAAAGHGGDVVVLERAAEPGGLARTECVEGWWFDHVLHLLHLADPEVQRPVFDLLGDVLRPCPPDARIVTRHGTVRYPFQLHLAGLDPAARDACVADFERASNRPAGPVRNYEELLRATFGEAMCEQFYFPYNRKLWCRPLGSLAPQGFQWNLLRPSLAAVRAGAAGADGRDAAYNRNGWYPRPPAGAPRRGMRLLAEAWADRVPGLRLGHTVLGVDPVQRIVRCAADGREVRFRYRRACVATTPLPVTAALTAGLPAGLRDACRALPANRVRSVALRIAGPRIPDTGLWRYYTDETMPFTRLIFQTAFDPLMAPPHGWGLLAEVIERSEDPPRPEPELIAAVVDGVRRAGLLEGGTTVAGTHVIDVDPAYVVFTPETAAVTEAVVGELRERDVLPLGRYGAWEYSSMEQVMGAGLAAGRALAAAPVPR